MKCLNIILVLSGMAAFNKRKGKMIGRLIFENLPSGIFSSKFDAANLSVLQSMFSCYYLKPKRNDIRPKTQCNNTSCHTHSSWYLQVNKYWCA